MIDSQIHVAIRSYKRVGNVKTLDVVPFAWVWVPESQGEKYKGRYGDRVVTIPDLEDGNPARKNNAILDRSPCPWTLILDDDITGIGRFEKGMSTWLKPHEIRWMIERGFSIASGLGVKMWGINQKKDPLLYDTYEPFNLLCPVLGPFHGHLEPVLRYDESALAKDDYDFWLQNIMVNRMVLRLNQYHYVHAHGSLPGGIVSMRTMDYERRGVERMRQKWGDKVFKQGGTAGGKSATGDNILNSRISIPIPGC